MCVCWFLSMNFVQLVEKKNNERTKRQQHNENNLYHTSSQFCSGTLMINTLLWIPTNAHITWVGVCVCLCAYAWETKTKEFLSVFICSFFGYRYFYYFYFVLRLKASRFVRRTVSSHHFCSLSFLPKKNHQQNEAKERIFAGNFYEKQNHRNVVFVFSISRRRKNPTHWWPFRVLLLLLICL